MVFPVTDPFDNMDQATLRSVSLESLRRIDRNRQQFLTTCPNRPHLEDASDEQRRLHFGAQLMGGFILGRGRMLPSVDPAQFLAALSGNDASAKTEKSGFFARIFAGSVKGPDPDLGERMIPVLATWPDFDKTAYMNGEPQSEEFMTEFSIDYPGLRELAFEANKPLRFGSELESHISLLSPILINYQESAFSGVESGKLEAFMEDAVAKLDDPDRDLEPVM